ncbi:MAG: prenyltransferase [Candidatus Latescibacterota bacterium]|nr:MAG: prenyltransferase [Candidatus Latescibacterota bacterium]
MRLPFIILTPACVVLGLGTAVWTNGSVNVLHVVLAFIGAVASHVSVNAFNEYFDFKSGLDFKTQRTPFSGGSGTLPEKPELARQALATAIISLAVVCAVGVYFLSVWGLALLPLGLAGVIVVVAYTPWFAHNAILCLVAPGVGFGSLMVVGTHFVLTGEYSWIAFVASLVPFFLVSNLLLLNQFPDVEADRSVGRKNFPILIGRRASSLIYGAFLLLAFLSIVFGVVFDFLPKSCLIALVALVLAFPAMIGAYRNADDIKKLIPALGMNVLINIITPVLVEVGLFIA